MSDQRERKLLIDFYMSKKCKTNCLNGSYDSGEELSAAPTIDS